MAHRQKPATLPYTRHALKSTIRFESESAQNAEKGESSGITIRALIFLLSPARCVSMVFGPQRTVLVLGPGLISVSVVFT